MGVTTQVLGVRYDYPLYLDGVIATNNQCLKLINNTQTQIKHILFILRRVCFISSPGRSLCLWLERETASSNLKGKRVKDKPGKMSWCKKVLVNSYSEDMLCLFQVNIRYIVSFSQHCTRAVVPSTRLLLGQFPVFQFHLSRVRTVFYQGISRLRFSSQELVCTSHRLHCALCT